MIKLGLVGCGRISGKHFDAIERVNGRANLAAVCDIDAGKFESLKISDDVRRYRALDLMLAEEELDLVSVCTPSGMHPKHAIQVANAGVHVLTEKPMATHLPDADAMIRACDESGVNLFVVKQNRLNSTLRLLKRAIDKNRFGRIYYVTVNVFWTRPQSYYDEAPWRGTWEFDGGAFSNQASHYVDMVDWLIGPVDSVMAYTGTMARKIEAEDTGVAALHFRNGAIGSINVTMLTYPRNMEGSITIIGENGTARIGGVAVNKIEHWEFAEYDDDDKMVETASYQTDSVYGYGHTGFYSKVLDVLEGNGNDCVSGRSGRRAVELVEAIYLSARDKRPVALPLKRGA
ncbi:MAG: Gfo/Idh/MocA family oxidoreductase [Pseudomonadota bacterium]|nr:MAG: Gfo/Idh/MocA family oxidoreductase [Pseudomonadota bacterium]